MTLEEYFSTGPERERPIFDAVMTHLTTLGPVHVEPVSVGIFIKKSGSFLELRPMTKWVRMSLPLQRRVIDRRIRTKPAAYRGRLYHFVDLVDASEVDDDVRGWLTEAWDLVP